MQVAAGHRGRRGRGGRSLDGDADVCHLPPRSHWLIPPVLPALGAAGLPMHESRRKGPPSPLCSFPLPLAPDGLGSSHPLTLCWTGPAPPELVLSLKCMSPLRAPLTPSHAGPQQLLLASLL